MNETRPNIVARALSCLRQRRMPDRLLALDETLKVKFGPSHYRRRQSRILRKTGSPPSLQNLKGICETALKAGAAIPLGDIAYGPAHWEKSGVLAQAPAYYYFLAGFVKSLGLTQIVEVGTWFGGSTQALERGLEGPGKIVTIDICQHNPDGLTPFDKIKRITGDAASPAVLNDIAAEIAPTIDLLYLDGDHRYESNRDILRLYGPRLRPRWVIMDDIHWQWSMEKLWAQVLKYHAPYALDAGTEWGFRCPGKNGNGFGVIDFRDRDDYRI